MTYRPPRDCPVCSSRLETTQLGCPTCGTGLSGHFAPCEFCGLDEADLQMLRVFLASRGQHARPGAAPRRQLPHGACPVRRPAAPARAGERGRRGPGGGGLARRRYRDEAERLATLQALAEGAVDVETARQRLGEA